MKILLVSTSDKTGGAAIACSRILSALIKSGADASMLVRDKVSASPQVFSVNSSAFRKAANFAAFCLERLRILLSPGISRSSLFQVSLDSLGAVGLANHPLVRQADVINIHWTSQGMMSLGQMQKLLAMGKRIAVTMHDMHHFTGICHYAGDCQNFRSRCGNCPHIAGGARESDLSARWLQKKKSMPGRGRILYIACSKWLAGVARDSSMMRGGKVLDIPNPIDTGIFRRIESGEARKKFGIEPQKRVLLFGAASIADARKGFAFLRQALQIISSQHPEHRGSIVLLVFGKPAPEMLEGLPFQCVAAGYLRGCEQLREAYSAADVYVTPSLEDNLPNTVMEAMSCSLPCVSFDVGGLPQLIDHQENGYLAKYKDAADLARGIAEVAFSPRLPAMRDSARRKVEENFSQDAVASRYIDAFNQLCL